MPDDLARQAVTHSSWTERRSESYERLAFLGGSVLSLAVTTHLYPLLDPDGYGAGQLTKIRAQTVSGRACRVVAERLGVPDRMRELAPEDTPANELLTRTERVLASIMEAIIGACYLEYGYDRTAAAVVDADLAALDVEFVGWKRLSGSAGIHGSPGFNRRWHASPRCAAS